MAGKTRIGIDIDGGTLRIVEVDDTGTAIAWRTIHGTDPVDALNRYSGKGDINLAVWSGNNTYLRPVQIVVVPDEALDAALQDAADENLPAEPGSLAVVGRRIGGEGVEANREPALIAGIAKADVENVWEGLLNIGAAMSVPQMCPFPDGLHLIVRRTVSELLLVDEGIPVQQRQFVLGSLDRIADAVEDDQLKTMIATGTNLAAVGQSPAASVVAQNIEELVNEVRRTIEFWQRGGTAVPSQLQVSGVGVALPGLAEALAAAGFQARAAAVPSDVNLRSLGAETLAYYSAALAAVASDVPTFTNPVAVARAEASAKRARRRQAIIYSLAAVIATVVLLTVPVVLALAQRASAEDDLKAAEDRYAALAEAEALRVKGLRAETLLNQLGNYEPLWNEIFDALQDAGGPGAVINEIQIRPNVDVDGVKPAAINVELAASIAGANDFTVVADWIRAIKELGATDVWASSFEVDNEPNATSNGVNVELHLTLPATSPWVEPRYPDLLPEGDLTPDTDDESGDGTDADQTTTTAPAGADS